MIAVCALTWLINLAYVIPTWLGWNTWTPQVPCDLIWIYPSSFSIGGLIGPFALNLTLIIILYIAIYHESLRRKKNKVHPTSDKRQELSQRKLSRELRLIKMFCIIIGSYGVCFFPFSIMTLIKISQMPDISDTVETLYNVSVVIIVCESVLNPIVYAFTLPEYKAAFRKILCCCKIKERQNTIHISVTSTAHH